MRFIKMMKSLMKNCKQHENCLENIASQKGWIMYTQVKTTHASGIATGNLVRSLPT